jgi:hypothetical protein
MKSLVIKVPNLSSLYSKEALPFLFELKEAIWSSNRHSLLVLVQEGPRRDTGPVDVDDLWFLRAQFSAYLHEWTEVLKQIDQLEIPVIYHATGDVLGSWFELCIVCKMRVFSDADFHFGFPQLKEGMIPLFDSLRTAWNNVEIRHFEFLEASPVRSWREFYVMKNWFRSAVPWKTLYFEVDSTESLIKILEASMPTNTSEYHPSRGPDAIELSLSKGTPGSKWFIRTWEAYKRSIRHARPSAEYIIDNFYKWASMNNWFHGSLVPPKVKNQTIVFRISHYFPPVQVVYSSIIQGWKVAFVFSERETAISYLNQLRQSLLELVGTGIGGGIWQNSIRWFESSESDRSRVASFEFKRDGEVSHSVFGVIGRRSSGNRFNTRLGVIEIDYEFEHAVSGMRTLGEEIVRSRARQVLGVWASVYVQKIFCKLLLHYERIGLDMFQAEVFLRSRGWGAFVMARYRELFFDFFPLTEEEYLDVMKTQAPKTPPVFISNLKLLSLHLKIVAGMLAKELVIRGVVDHIAEADRLVSSSIEAPETLKSAVGLANGFSAKRVEEDFALVPAFIHRYEGHGRVDVV